MYVCCVHVAAGNIASVLLLVGFGDMEFQQPCLSWAVISNTTYFHLQVMTKCFLFPLVNVISEQK